MIRRVFGMLGKSPFVWVLAVILASLAVLVLNSSERSFQANLVALEGNLEEVQREDVFRRLIEIADKKQSIQQLKAALEEVEWIHRVEIRKNWPNSLTVLVIEEKPIAYWNDDAFINVDGKVFLSSFEVGGDLAQLYGPVGTEKQVMQQYQQLSNALLKAGQSIDILTLDDRGAWKFTNHAGVQVLLGKDDIKERIQRYLQVVEYGGLMAHMDNIISIDTRYSNGLAVNWQSPEKDLAYSKKYKTQRELRL